MVRRLVECVPNISEGKNREIIDAVASVVETVEGVKLLDIDPGSSTNRTVITFVGEPDVMVEAAFRLIKRASELIDMRKHKGEHPRMGATDVCPFVPVSNVSMEECIELAKALGKRVGEELNIPVYLYENAAQDEKRRNLAYCRSGEYEGMTKISKPEWRPDFGPNEFNDHVRQTGVTAIGARDFLVAYNINLNTTSTRRANAVAFDIREAGRIKREGNPLTGKKVLDENGNPVREPGSLKAVKGIGWYIEEYGIAQLSLNLTNINITSVHEAFDEASERARARGLRVTGSEIVGLIPKKVLIDAAHHYLRKQERSFGISEAEKIKIAVKSLGLDDLKPFDPHEKVIEYMIDDASDKKRLIDLNLIEFAQETSYESPAPGGGSIAAYVGALGVSLGTMVANLSAHKRGWDDRWEEFSEWAVRGMELQENLLSLVDEDTEAFNRIMEAYGMPKGNDNEKAARKQAIQDATKFAIEIPLRVARTALHSMEVMKQMAAKGNPNSVTDAGVGALCARTAVIGAAMNVQVNTGDLEDAAYSAKALDEAAELIAKAETLEKEVREIVQEVLAK